MKRWWFLALAPVGWFMGFVGSVIMPPWMFGVFVAVVAVAGAGILWWRERRLLALAREILAELEKAADDG